MMQTSFSEQQLKDPSLQRANEILRSCVHCGLCTATCPTYQLLGDELDSPRGRIYLMKDMLENGRPADAATVKHIDRCLSCLACMTTCPSGVHYMHLVDYTRQYIEETYRRPLTDRLLRWLLKEIIPYPRRFRLSLLGARIGKGLSGLMPDARLRAMLEMAPDHIPPVSRDDDPQEFSAIGKQRWRVVLMTGCAQKALRTNINEATVRLLRRVGCDVVVSGGVLCCGALTHHMGKVRDSHRQAEASIRAWSEEVAGDGVDAIIINASGCGTTVKDYGYMFRNSELAEQAKAVSERALDITEFLDRIGMPQLQPKGIRVTYHAACSLQHGQSVKSAPRNLLCKAGFKINEPVDSHLCCGSAGTYNLLQPELSARLKQRKIKAIEQRKPDVVASGNIGCIMQIGAGTNVPVVHTVELLDWAMGGEVPPGMDNLAFAHSVPPVN